MTYVKFVLTTEVFVALGATVFPSPSPCHWPSFFQCIYIAKIGNTIKW